jgi:foldase protein PrsA
VSSSSTAASRPRSRARAGALNRTLVLGLIGAVALSSCATFTESNQVARVGSVVLERSELDALLTDTTPGAATGDRINVDMTMAHNLLNSWLLTEILRGELDAAGLSVSAEDREIAIAELLANYGPTWEATTGAALRALQIEQQAVISRWSVGLADAISPEQVRAAYEAGHEASMVICVSHILTATVESALTAQAELAAGRSFEDVAAEYSLDQATAINGGALPCGSTGQFTQAYVGEFAEAALAATIGVPTDIVPTAFGYHIIRLDPYTDLRAAEINNLYLSDGMRFQRAARAAKVYVDPRYGSFDPQSGVMAIG